MGRGVALLIVVSSALGIVIACGGSGRRPADPACVRWFDATLSWSERCGVPVTSLTIGESRRLHYETVCERALFSRGAARARQYLESCAEKLEARECSGGELLDCEPLPGELADGAGCAYDLQCQSGFCKHELAFGSDESVPRVQTCGTCTARIAIGDTCNEARLDKCAYGSQCVDFICDTLAAPEGRRCASSSACAPDLRCERLVPTGARCERRLSFGAACSSSVQCASGLACAGASGAGDVDGGPLDTPAGTCRELLQGEHCTSKRGCARGLGCDPDTRRCTPIKYVSKDEACDENVRRCKSGLCVHTNVFLTTDPLPIYGACFAHLDDGAPCSNPIECEPPAICGLSELVAQVSMTSGSPMNPPGAPRCASV